MRVSCPALREPIRRRTLSRRLAGRLIVGLRRRAKYLLVDVEGDSTLVIHLGMSGRVTLADPSQPREPHQHVVFDLESGRQLRFRDPRRFGLVFALATGRLERDRHFRHLGVEPLGARFDGRYLERRASGRRAPVKSFLMDSKIVVGVGNIYACEALFRAGIHPARKVGRIAAKRWLSVARSIVEVLEEAIVQGGTTLNDFADAEGSPGYFQLSLDVYGREGAVCRRCRQPIRRRVHSNRSTFYCSGCQH